MINSIQNVTLLFISEVDLLRKMLQKQPELRISAAEALRHPYFTDSDDKMYVLENLDEKKQKLCR